MNAHSLFSYKMSYPFTPDWASLFACYQPIMGLEAAAVYQSLVTLVDTSQAPAPFHAFLSQVEMPLEKVTQAFDALSALGLVALYEEKEAYLVLVQPVLSMDAFLGNPLYKALLEKYIGESAVARLKRFSVPVGAKPISKTFADVFDDLGEIQQVQGQPYGFELTYFKQQMGRDGLRFADEKEDTIALYRLAEQEGWTWFETYQLAKKTAVGQVISTKRMQQQLAGQGASKPQLSQQETALLAQYKGDSALEFLAKIKRHRKATITQAERNCLAQLADLGLLDEVINVLLAYTFAKVDSANLNEKYILKVANDMSYQGIASAEQAIAALRDKRPTAKAVSSKPATSNVPEWSKKEVNTQSTAEGQARLAALRQQMQANEGTGGPL